MTNILHLDASARYEESVSRQLSAHLINKLLMTHSGAKVVYRDLTAHPIPHPNSDFIAALFKGVQNSVLALSDELLNELLAADILVIGTPMYNLNVPSQLKVWIDYVCRAGKTFKYVDAAPIGLLTEKRAYVTASTGGIYTSGPMGSFNHVTPYLNQILGFIGITNVLTAVAEKQGMGPEAAAAGVKTAYSEVDDWF
jgi:FMN-dependent NADH-azoreductase